MKRREWRAVLDKIDEDLFPRVRAFRKLSRCTWDEAIASLLLIGHETATESAEAMRAAVLSGPIIVTHVGAIGARAIGSPYGIGGDPKKGGS